MTIALASAAIAFMISASMLLELVTWVLVSLVSASTSSSSTGPQPPGAPEACTRWHGTASGNDPSVQITATLCERGDNRVTGTLVWQSDRSGRSTRTLEGTRSKDALVLRDTSLEGTPNRGWRFCIIDRYQLAGAGTDRLSGTYHSTRCRDQATLELTRIR